MSICIRLPLKSQINPALSQKLDQGLPLIHPALQPAEQAALLRKLCLKLANTHRILPTNFFLIGVKCLSNEPIDSGAYADIYKGNYNNTVVILKRPRITSEQKKEQVTAVRNLARHPAA